MNAHPFPGAVPADFKGAGGVMQWNGQLTDSDDETWCVLRTGDAKYLHFTLMDKSSTTMLQHHRIIRITDLPRKVRAGVRAGYTFRWNARAAAVIGIEPFSIARMGMRTI